MEPTPRHRCMGGEVKNMRALGLAIGALVIVAGCGRIPGAQVPAGDYKLYEANSSSLSQNVSVIDSRSHRVDLSLPLGTPSPDWTHLYTVGSSALVDLEPKTGASLHRMQLSGRFYLPPATVTGVPGGLSQNGRWLVLESFDATSNGVRTATHLLVVDTSYAKAARQINLNGFFDKSDGSSAMAGVRLSGIPSHDGQWLYSVYVREDKSAFIHALNLDVPFALCLDLPGSGYMANPDEFHWSLAMNGAGTHLYAANGATGIVADLPIDNGAPGQMRVVKLNDSQTGGIFGVLDAQAKELGGNAAAVSPDGRTLVIAGKTGVLWVDTASLKTRDRQLPGWSVWSLAMSPDGTTLYVVDYAGMIAEVPMAGAARNSTRLKSSDDQQSYAVYCSK